jgi:hypothetical protein
MANKVPYRDEKPKATPSKVGFGYNQEMSPVWAKLLFKGVQKRDKLKKSVHALKDDPSMLFKGVLGKSLLDKHINPFLDKLLPDSTRLDVLRREFKFQPHDRFDMTLGKKGRGAKLDLNWRF